MRPPDAGAVTQGRVNGVPEADAQLAQQEHKEDVMDDRVSSDVHIEVAAGREDRLGCLDEVAGRFGDGEIPRLLMEFRCVAEPIDVTILMLLTFLIKLHYLLDHELNQAAT